MNKKITLACSQCGTRNYSTTTKHVSDRLELKKFCKACNAHTIHRETK